MIADIALFVAGACFVTAMIGLMGLAITRFLLRCDSAVAIRLCLPIGLAFVVFSGGVLALLVDGGIRSYLIVFWSSFALIGLVQFGALVRELLLQKTTRVLPIVCGIVVIALSVAVAVNLYREIYGLGPFVVTSRNNDILSYAYLAKQVAVLGLNEPGWIIGFDAGQAARDDVLGAFPILSGSGIVLGDELGATLPTIAGVVSIIAAGAYALLRTFRRVPVIAAALVSVICVVTYSAAYDMYQYFLAEKIATALVFAGLLVLRSRVPIMSAIVMQAIIAAALLLVYPQALPVYAATAGLFALVQDHGERAKGSVRRYTALLSLAAGMSLGLVMMGPVLLQRIERMRILLDVVAGWMMPSTTLIDAIGIRDPFASEARGDTAAVELVAAVLVIVITFALVRHRAKYELLFSLPLLLPFVVYVRFTLNQPDSYRQWKAMAFAAPFAVCAVALIIATIAGLGYQRWPTLRPVFRAGVVAIAAAWLVLAFQATFNPIREYGPCMWPGCPITQTVRDGYAQVDRDLQPGPTAIEAGSFWPSMTAVYLLWGHPLVLRSTTYQGGGSTLPARQTYFGPGDLKSSR